MKPAEASFNEGLKALNNERLSEAKSLFEETLKKDKGHVLAVLGLAEVATKQGKIREAEGYLKRAISLSPDDYSVQVAWGRFLYTQKRYSEAETALKKAASIAPDKYNAFIDLGTLYINGFQSPERAIPNFEKALKINPVHAGGHYALGMALFQTKKYGDAENEFKESSRLDPDNPLPIYQRGLIYAAQGETEAALNTLSAAIAINPKFFVGYMSRGELYMSLGKDHNALEDYSKVIELSPKIANAYISKGMIYQRNKRYDEAKEAYLGAIRADANSALAYNNLAWMAAEEGRDLDSALKWAKKAVELAPKVLDFQDTLGWVYRARKEYERAAECLIKALSSESPSANVYYRLGVVYSEWGKKKESRESLEKALSLAEKTGNAQWEKDARQLLEKLK